MKKEPAFQEGMSCSTIPSQVRAPCSILRDIHTWLVRLVAGVAMEKVYLAPCLTGKLGRSQEEVGNI